MHCGSRAGELSASPSAISVHGREAFQSAPKGNICTGSAGGDKREVPRNRNKSEALPNLLAGSKVQTLKVAGALP